MTPQPPLPLTPPVDIMHIAAVRLYTAAAQVRHAAMMDVSSDQSATAYQNALVLRDMAEQDMAAVRYFAKAIAAGAPCAGRQAGGAVTASARCAMTPQPPLPLTPPVECKRCEGTGHVYYRQYAAGHIVLGGKRVPCPECNGTGWAGGDP